MRLVNINATDVYYRHAITDRVREQKSQLIMHVQIEPKLIVYTHGKSQHQNHKQIAVSHDWLFKYNYYTEKIQNILLQTAYQLVGFLVLKKTKRVNGLTF